MTRLNGDEARRMAVLATLRARGPMHSQSLLERVKLVRCSAGRLGTTIAELRGALKVLKAQGQVRECGTVRLYPGGKVMVWEATA